MTQTRIEVTRSRTDGANVFRRYKVWVDDEPAGRLKRGESVTIPVTPGAHVVRCTLDWTGAPPLLVETTEGEDIKLEVSAASYASMAKGFFNGRSWLKLRVIDSP